MLRDGLLLSLDPHDCRVTSPYIGVLIPSGALQKELNRQQSEKKLTHVVLTVVNAPVEAKNSRLTGLLYTPQVGSRGLLTTLWVFVEVEVSSPSI